MAVRPVQRTEGRSAPTSRRGVHPVRGTDTHGGGTNDTAGRGGHRGPWVFNCLYTAQKTKKKKAWKDGYCVCVRMTGFLRLTLFGAEKCGQSSLIWKASRDADALDTTELPLRPVEQLVEEEIELPLHLVLVQGFKVQQERTSTGTHEQPLDREPLLQLSGTICQQPREGHEPPEQRKTQLQRTSASPVGNVPRLLSCAEATLSARRKGASQYATVTSRRASPPQTCATKMLHTPGDASSISHEAAGPLLTANDTNQSHLTVRPPQPSSGSEVAEYQPGQQKARDRQNCCKVEEDLHIDISPCDTIGSAPGQHDEVHCKPQSPMSGLRKEVLSILSDTQRRRCPATQVMLRMSRSLFSHDRYFSFSKMPANRSTHPYEVERGETAVASMFRIGSGSYEQMMFSRALKLSARSFYLKTDSSAAN